MKKRCLDVVDCLLLLLRPVAREAEVVEDLNAGMLTAAAFFRKKRREFRAGHLLFLKRKFLAEQIFEINNSFAKDPTFLKQNAIAFATVSVIKLDSF